MKGKIKKVSISQLQRDARRYRRAITKTSDPKKKEEYAKKAAKARKELQSRRVDRIVKSMKKK